jgi:hypothetical protein
MGLRGYTMVVDCLDVAAPAQSWRETLGWQEIYEADYELQLPVQALLLALTSPRRATRPHPARPCSREPPCIAQALNNQPRTEPVRIGGRGHRPATVSGRQTEADGSESSPAALAVGGTSR